MNLLNADHPVKPDLSPQLLALLTRHRDLTRKRLAITREIEAVQRQIQAVETNTRRSVSGVVITAVALN